MKVLSRRLQLLIGLLGAIALPPNAWGQDCPCPSGGALAAQHDEMRMAILDELPSGEFGVNGQANNLAACSGPFCNYACRSEGITFSTEIVFVDVWQPDSDLAAQLLEFRFPSAAAIDNLNPESDPSPLITLGYLTCDGLGFQVRFWEFDNSVSAAVPPPVVGGPNLVTQAWDVMVIDTEVVYSSFYRQVWDVTLSGGYRFAEYEEGATLRNTIANTQLGKVSSRYVGNGLTGAVNVRRQLTNHFSIIANPRYSLLLGGESIANSSDVNLPERALKTNFDARYVLEAKLGVAWESPICGGGAWFARGGYELQYWNDFAPPVSEQDQHSSTVFSGFFFAVGLQR